MGIPIRKRGLGVGERPGLPAGLVPDYFQLAPNVKASKYSQNWKDPQRPGRRGRRVALESFPIP
jgi:hypothetical protein